MRPGSRRTPPRSRRRALAVLVAGCATLAASCRRPRTGAAGRGQSGASLGERLLALAADAGHPGAQDGAAARAELERIQRQVEAARAGGLGPVEALNQVVFEKVGFSREIEERGGRFMLLPPVLESHRGSCVGLGSLYLVLAERLGWPAHGVLVPGHFFVRVEEAGAPRSVELLRRGETMPESWYRQKYSVPEEAPSAYLRPLAPEEVVSVVHFNLGNEARERKELEAARAHYAAAVEGFPDFPEAQASLGLALHLLGRLPEARAAYERAARLHPQLPGLDKNLQVLEEESQGR